MSQAEGSIGSPSTSAAPPPAPSAAAPPAAPPSPAAAPVAPAAPAVAGPAEAIVSDAVAPSEPGASPSKPATLDEVTQRYLQQLEGKQAEGTQPEAAQPAEAQPTEPETPVEAQPAEEAEPVVEPVETAPEEELAAPVEAEGEDTDYLENVLSAEEIESRFARKLSKTERAEVAKREAHRGELLKKIDAIGSDLGVQISSVINPIILGKEDPTDEDVDAIFDQIVLPDNAGAGKLFDLMGKRLVNTQLQEADCGSCLTDGNKPNPKCSDHVPAGKVFASDMISEEWGKNEDGTSFDFFGMKPLELVDFLIRAAKAKDEEGEPILQMEFLKQELEGKGKPAPTENELRLQRENEELRNSTKADREAKEAEEKRKSEELKARYQTDARKVVSEEIMRAVTPLAVKANWALAEGEDGAQAQEKKELGQLIADHVNFQLMGAHGAPSPEYAAVQQMIDEHTAFDPVTGAITPRFKLKLVALQNKAKALFNHKQVALSSRFKFSAAKSRNAQLVKNNGSKAVAQPADAAAPPLAEAPKPQPERPLTAVEKLAEVERKYYEDAARQQTPVGVR